MSFLHTRLYTHACTHPRTHVHTRTQKDTHARTHINAHKHTLIQTTYPCTYVRTYSCLHLCTHTTLPATLLSHRNLTERQECRLPPPDHLPAPMNQPLVPKTATSPICRVSSPEWLAAVLTFTACVYMHALWCLVYVCILMYSTD